MPMTDRRTRDPYTNFNFRVVVASLLAVAAGFLGMKASRQRGAGRSRNFEAAFMRRLRHTIRFPRPRPGRKTQPGINDLLLDHLEVAGIDDPTAVDRLITGSRSAAREALGLQTLGQTDRLLAALRLARNQMDD